MRIAVAGGTGLVGRYVVAELRAAGHEPVVITRSGGADVIPGLAWTPRWTAPRRRST